MIPGHLNPHPNSTTLTDVTGPAARAEQQRQVLAEQTCQSAESMRPKLSPAELLASFASRGIVIAADEKGDLLVTPARLLSDTDRTVLRANKAGIIEALRQNAEVL